MGIYLKVYFTSISEIQTTFCYFLNPRMNVSIKVQSIWTQEYVIKLEYNASKFCTH